MMRQPDKYLIIAADMTDYDATIRRHGLNPGWCFQCQDEAEAERTVQANQRWGIPTVIIRTSDVSRKERAS